MWKRSASAMSARERIRSALITRQPVPLGGGRAEAGPSSPCSCTCVRPIRSAACATSSSVGLTNTPTSSARRRTRARDARRHRRLDVALGARPEDEADRPGAQLDGELGVLGAGDAADLDAGHAAQGTGQAGWRRGRPLAELHLHRRAASSQGVEHPPCAGAWRGPSSTVDRPSRAVDASPSASGVVGQVADDAVTLPPPGVPEQPAPPERRGRSSREVPRRPAAAPCEDPTRRRRVEQRPPEAGLSAASVWNVVDRSRRRRELAGAAVSVRSAAGCRARPPGRPPGPSRSRRAPARRARGRRA